MYEQPYNPFVKNLSAVKDYFKSPVVLVYGILQALATVLSLASVILISTKLKDIIGYFRGYVLYFCDEIGASASDRSRIQNLFDQVDVSSGSSSVLSSIPTVLVSGLMVAAIFIIYFKSRNADPSATPITGFTILYVFSVIALVFSILAAIAVALFFVLMFLLYTKVASATAGHIAADFSDVPIIGTLIKNDPSLRDALDDIGSNVLLVMIIVLLVVMAIVFFFVFFTAINRMRYYKSVRQSLSTVELQTKGAKPYAVMCMISAVSTGLSLTSFVSLLFPPHLKGQSNPMTGIAVLLMASTAVSFVSLILEWKIALGYKNHIDSIKYGYNTPAAPAAPYAPFAQAPGFFGAQNQPMNNPYVRYAPPVPEQETAPQAQDTGAENAYADPYGTDEPDSDRIDDLVNEISAESMTEDAPAETMENAAADNAIPEAAPTCPLCGAEVDPTAPFCGNCGNRL